jgi:hypothetical protein
LIEDQSIGYITHHTVDFLKLAAVKAIYFWAPALPGWSVRHIALWAPVLGAIDLLAIAGLRAQRSAAGPFEFGVIVLAAFTLTSMLTFTDFDQRYRLPASLAIAMFAGAGADFLFARWLFGRRHVALHPRVGGLASE